MKAQRILQALLVPASICFLCIPLESAQSDGEWDSVGERFALPREG